MRWIFQIMEGIHIIRIYRESMIKSFKEVITNLNELRKKIIGLFGETACQMYGLIQRNNEEMLVT